MIKHITTTKTARYYVLGDIATASHVWFVLHGYGEDVRRFADRCSVLADAGTAVIAPEGLHRFYKKGFIGDVGASWMTKEDRENDITDYVTYLNLIFAKEVETRQTVSVLGFSQGSATACRWVADGVCRPANLVLWAGLFPPDIDLYSGHKFFHKPKLILASSPTDEFRTSGQWERQDSLLRNSDLRWTDFEFEGGHRIVGPELKRLVETHINPSLTK